jgi:hypothetical protein
MDLETKWCGTCKNVFPVSQFYTRQATAKCKIKAMSECKTCHKKRTKANKEKRVAAERESRK